MCDYSDLFTSIDTFNTDDMVYIKPLDFYTITRSMGVYHRRPSPNNDKGDKRKIIVKTPKLMVPIDIKEFDNDGDKTFKLIISLSTMTNLYNEDEIKKFYSFLKKIDNTNENTIKEHLKKWKLPTSLKYNKTTQRYANYPPHINLTLPHDPNYGFTFKVFDENAKPADISIISSKSVVSLIMELTDLKFTDTHFRANWKVMQIRKYKPYSPINEFFMSGCFLCDEDDPEDIAYTKLIEKYQSKLQTPLHIPPIHNLISPQYQQPAYGQTQQPPPPPPPPFKTSAKPQQTQPSQPTRPTFVPPSLDEILHGIKSLKKVKPNEKNYEPKKKHDDDDNLSESKKKDGLKKKRHDDNSHSESKKSVSKKKHNDDSSHSESKKSVSKKKRHDKDDSEDGADTETESESKHKKKHRKKKHKKT